MTRQPDYDPGLWGPPMPFHEAIALSKNSIAGLFDDLPDNYAEDAPGTVLNAGVLPGGRPHAINANHSRAPELDALVHERSDWHAFRPKDAVTRLGEVAR